MVDRSEKCKYCSGWVDDHDADCMLNELRPTHTLKEYHSPELIQLRLETRIIQAAEKWFEIEKIYSQRMVEHRQIPIDKKLAKEQNIILIIEELGKKAVLLLDASKEVKESRR